MRTYKLKNKDGMVEYYIEHPVKKKILRILESGVSGVELLSYEDKLPDNAEECTEVPSYLIPLVFSLGRTA